MNNGSAGHHKDDSITQELKVDIKEHLSKFDDIEKFFELANLALQTCFSRQTKYANIDSFKEHIKWIITEYKAFFSLTTYAEKKAKLSRMNFIEGEYNELIYFREKNLVKERKERIETGITIEEQEWQAKGLVLFFGKLVRKVLWDKD